MVMLQRAQGQTDAAARKTQLESAEKVFLAIGGIAGRSDAYQLSLGQVDYWLGKQAEGCKLFDDYLAKKGASPRMSWRSRPGCGSWARRRRRGS